MDSPWGKLVRCSAKENEYFPILRSTHTIGRKPECDIMVTDNRASGIHCVITRRGKKGGPTVKDLSTNGTLLNGKRLDKKLEVELRDQDCITVVQEKENPAKSVTYKFVDLRDNEKIEATLSYEEDATQMGTLTEEGTLRDTVSEHEDGVSLDSTRKRKRPPEDEESCSVPKLRAIASEESEVLHGITEPASSSSGGGPAVPTLVKKDSIEETLICQICQEILHDCVSLQPCMHSYCGGCYSDWMGTSNTCPACRKRVVRIGKNHIVNNLVDAYLRANPEKKRPEEDLRELDVKNKITSDIDYSAAKASSRRLDKGDDYDDDYSSSGSTSPASTPPPGITATTFFPLSMPTFCLQCPGYRGFPLGPLPSAPFTCTLATRHVMCNCCLRSMPLRDDDPTIIQKCSLCSCNFCHLYWTCTKPGCLGCLGKFKDVNLPNTCLNGILGNAFESTILKDYLDRKSWSIKDFLGILCEQLDNGDLGVTSHGIAVSPLTMVCHVCAKDVMKKLAYDYRKALPDGELPAAVTGRPNCYWGKECRTQYSNPSHARRYNHICEKTRTS